MREFIKALCVFLVLSACENVNDKTVYKPRSSGNINDLSVVIDNELWESPVGETIRSTIGAPLYGLPQDEPSLMEVIKYSFGFMYAYSSPKRY